MPEKSPHSAAEIWETALAQLVLRVTRQNFENWLRNTRGIRFDGTSLVVATPNDLSRDWLSTRMRPVVTQALTSAAGSGLGVQFETAAAAGEDRVFVPTQPSLVAGPAPAANPRFTFDTFVPGKHNEIALTAALDVAADPASPYSPLFVTGPSGSGKTHLLHAVAHASTEQENHAVLVNADQFIGDFTAAVRSRSGPAFRAKYRHVDLFLMDDAHLLVGKKASQVEFYQTVSALHDEGRRVVIAGDHRALACEVASRFDTPLAWGLVAAIATPDMPERMNFLESRLQIKGIDLEPEVIQYIALRVRSSQRDLEGAINRVLAYARMTAAPVTIDLAAKALQALEANPHARTVPQPTELMTQVCNHLGITQEDVVSSRRDRTASYARHLAMFLLRQDAGLTYAAIASLLHRSDHSTVVHACAQIEHQAKVNPSLRADIDAVRAALRSTAA